MSTPMQIETQTPSLPPDHQVRFLIGRDGEGHWLAVETHGHGGGIFKSRDTALQYARDESRRQPGAVRFVDEPIRLFAA